MNFETYLTLAAAAVGIFSIVATLTPNKADNKIADALLKIINVLGQNYGKAKNK